MSESSSAPELSGGSDDDDVMDIDQDMTNDDTEPMPNSKQQLRATVASVEELQFLADNTPNLSDEEDEEDDEATPSDRLRTRAAQDLKPNLTLTDPPSGFDAKQMISDTTGSVDTPVGYTLPHQISHFSDGNLSEEEDIMYKDHRRSTVEQYAEKNKYKSRLYRNFAKAKSANGVDDHDNSNKSTEEIKFNELPNLESNNTSSPKVALKPIDSTASAETGVTEDSLSKSSKSKLPAPPPKKRNKGNELMRQYLLNAIQVRKLNNADTMQEIMIQVGNMASFFVQPGNKLFVHLHGTNAPSTNPNDSAYDGSNYNTLQIWEHVEDLLEQRIGDLQQINK